MKLSLQKRLAAAVSNCSEKRIKFDTERLDEIKEAITKADIRRLIKDKAMIIQQKKGSSRFRARARKLQKSKGRQKGFGSRKGKKTARLKKNWINKVRLQRNFISNLRNKNIINKPTHRELYLKVKGGFFRSNRHIKLYIEEHNLATKK